MTNAFERELSVRWDKREQRLTDCKHVEKRYNIVTYRNRRNDDMTDFLEVSCIDCDCRSYVNLEVFARKSQWFYKIHPEKIL